VTHPTLLLGGNDKKDNPLLFFLPYFPRIENIIGVEEGLDVFHYYYGGGVHGFLEKALLFQADAVLAGKHAPQFERDLY